MAEAARDEPEPGAAAAAAAEAEASPPLLLDEGDSTIVPLLVPALPPLAAAAERASASALDVDGIGGRGRRLLLSFLLLFFFSSSLVAGAA